jgi:uncharacterized membrane protein
MNISWRTNLWLAPSLIVAAALAVFVVTQSLDRAHYRGAITLPGWLDQGSAADARALLSATAGAIITTLGLVLSITVLTLSIAASQFGQRLLRRYMRDRGTQACIGIFAATFVFSLLTLMSVTSRSNEKEYVPWLSIWISTIWALACIGVLIYYINHVAVSIQVNNVLAGLSKDFRWVIRQNHRLPETSRISIPEMRTDLALAASATGYIQLIDYQPLVLVAAELDAVVRFLFRPGQFVVKGSTLAVAEGRELPASRLAEVFCRTVRIGVRRTLAQDPEFALAQIVEIALRAMSPGINDPYTAVTCVHWLTDGLRELAQYAPRSGVHADIRGNPRVIEHPNEFQHVVAAAYGPIRQVARNSPMLTIGILNSISLIAPFVESEAWKEALNTQAQLAWEGLSSGAVNLDRQDVKVAYRLAVEAFRSPACLKKAIVMQPQHS